MYRIHPGVSRNSPQRPSYLFVFWCRCPFQVVVNVFPNVRCTSSLKCRLPDKRVVKLRGEYGTFLYHCGQYGRGRKRTLSLVAWTCAVQNVFAVSNFFSVTKPCSSHTISLEPEKLAQVRRTLWLMKNRRCGKKHWTVLTSGRHCDNDLERLLRFCDFGVCCVFFRERVCRW